MFFIISKIVWFLISPLNLIWLLMVSGYLIINRHPNLGYKMIFTGVVLFVLLGVLPIGHNLTVFLEKQYLRERLPKQVDGIIVLGGAFNTHISNKTGQLALNENIGRMVEFVALSKIYPNAKLVFSGGSGRLLSKDRKEAEDAQTFLGIMGVQGARLIIEPDSRNTYENVVFTKKLVEPKPDEKWIVITSAFHMPRTMGIFEQQGWKVIPYVSAPRTDGEYQIYPRSFSILGQFYLLSNAIKEFVGSATYYFSGKSAFLLPMRPLESETESK